MSVTGPHPDQARDLWGRICIKGDAIETRSLPDLVDDLEVELNDLHADMLRELERMHAAAQDS